VTIKLLIEATKDRQREAVSSSKAPPRLAADVCLHEGGVYTSARPLISLVKGVISVDLRCARLRDAHSSLGATTRTRPGASSGLFDLKDRDEHSHS
jgi:hypothetical protein